METPSAKLLPLLTKAAELRATGATWAKVSEELHRSAETCREWPRRYPETWLRLYREAAGLRVAEAAVEAQLYLRKLVRHADPKVSLRAAQLLQQAWEDHMNREDKARRPGPAQAAAELVEFAKHVKGMTDDQLATLLADVVAPKPAADQEPGPGTGAPPGPTRPQ